MHIRFFASDKNEAAFCTNVDFCAGIDIGNIRLYQWIITANTYIIDRYIQFYEDNTFDPIHLNYTLDE